MGTLSFVQIKGIIVTGVESMVSIVNSIELRLIPIWPMKLLSAFFNLQGVLKC